MGDERSETLWPLHFSSGGVARSGEALARLSRSTKLDASRSIIEDKARAACGIGLTFGGMTEESCLLHRLHIVH